MNYSIIQFEDGVEVVPDKWLVGENMCYWPPMNSDKLTLHKLVLSKANVEKNWVQYTILKIFCHADTYQRAVQKLKLALEMSDIDTSDESLKKTRHSRHHKVADEFDESDVDHFTPSFIPNERKKEKKRRPSPLDSDEDDVEACPEMSSKLPPFPSSANFTLVENRKNNTADDEILPIRNSVPQQCMSMSRASTPSSVTNTRVSIRGTDEILMKLNTLLSITKIIENRLTLIERSVSNLQGEGNAKAPSSSCMEAKEFNKMFPLTSEVDLLNFEENLKDDTFFNKMIATLCTVGGTDVQSITVNILKKILSNSLANLFSLHGKKKKKIFKSLNTCNLIVDTVRKQKTGTTEVEILAIIGSWLPQSNLRLSREQRKQKGLEQDNE